MRVLITGTSRGMGLEFVRQYAARGDHVFAGVRNPETAVRLEELRRAMSDRVTIVPMDVADEESICQSHALVRSHTDGLDVIVNNAGIGTPERLGTMDVEGACLAMRTMAIGPLLIAQEFMDLLRACPNGKVANVTSGYGSISSNNGFPYYYSAAKAALHQYMRSLAADIRRWGMMTVLLDPGSVRTDMGGPSAPLMPEESVAGMIRVVDALTLEQSGAFVNWQGKPMPW